MKKIIFLAAAVLSFAACSKEEVVTAEKSSVTTSKGTKLTFNFISPRKAPVIYTRAAVNHTDAERKIHRLDIYQFDGYTEEAQLEKIYSNVTYKQEGTSDKHTAQVIVEELGDKRFALVTNNLTDNPGHIAGIVNPTVKSGNEAGLKFSTFKKLTTATLTTTPLNGHPLIMTDYKDLSLAIGVATPDVEAKLVRVMARIDITNQDHNFVLKHVQLKNAKSQAYLLPDAKEGEAPTSSTQLSAPAGIVDFPEIELPTDNTNPKIGFSTEGDVTTYKHVFYPYPSNTGTTLPEGPVIVLKGTLSESGKNPVDVTYEYALKKDKNTYLGFKRNHVYTLVIKKAISEEKLDASFQVTRWHEDEIVAPVVEIAPPRLVGAENNPSVFNVDLKQKLITVEKAGGTITLYFESNRALEIKPEPIATSWIVNPRITNASADHRTRTSYVATFTIPSNQGTDKRSAKIKVLFHKFIPEVSLLLDVVQKGS